ncbi:amidohydrolase family protein [Deinococcus sp. UYEF24]
MSEPAAWRYQQIIRPMFDRTPTPQLLRGRILTALTPTAIEDGVLELQGGTVVAAGPASEFGARAEEAERVSGTLMPGLINSHAHLAWDGVHDLASQSMNDSPEISAYKSAGNMLISLRAGITTVRDLGMRSSNLSAKQAVVQGIFPGPRLLVCGEAIVQTGGHTYWCCREATGPDEMRRAVREQVRAGADLIKIMACHDTLEFTDEELHAVIDETHRFGLTITAHATFDACIRRVAEFGVDCIEHGGGMSDETIQLLLDNNIPIVTTFAPLVMQSQPELARQYQIPEWKIAERQKAVADTSRFESLVRAARAGVTIGFGTDAGSPVVQHSVVAPELQFMLQLGLVASPYEALLTATRTAAQINRLDDLGTLKPGQLADVILIDGQPDQDLEALNRVSRVYLAGKRMV